MSSLFKGLGDVLGPKPLVLPTNKTPANYDIVRIGQVLDVILDSSSEYYINDEAVGAIRFRFIPQDYRLQESSISKFALPVDRLRYRVPLPGEQVIIYPIKYGNTIQYGYGPLIQQQYNNAYNSHPYIATAPKYVTQDQFQLLALTTEEEQSRRFIDKLQIPIAYYEDASLHPPVAIREGDTIIQNRFGSQIRFTSTVEKTTVKALDKRQSTIGLDIITNDKASDDGDPLIILQASRLGLNSLQQSYSNTSVDSLGLSDTTINNTDATIYLTSTQAVPIDIACSRKLFSWNIEIIKAPLKRFADQGTTTLAQTMPNNTYNPADAFTINVNIALGDAMSLGGGLDFGSVGTAQGLAESEALAYELILSREGIILEAMWDISNWRIGHGSSTFTLADGSIIKLPDNKSQWPSGFNQATKQLIFTNIGNEVQTKGKPHDDGYLWVAKNSGRASSPLITKEDAGRDLARRIKNEFLPDTKRDVIKACKQAGLDGETVWASLGKGAHAALCSIKYNYGNVTKNGAANAAAQSQGNKDALANWIQNQLQGGSKDRHRSEAFTCSTGQVRR